MALLLDETKNPIIAWTHLPELVHFQDLPDIVQFYFFPFTPFQLITSNVFHGPPSRLHSSELFDEHKGGDTTGEIYLVVCLSHLHV